MVLGLNTTGCALYLDSPWYLLCLILRVDFNLNLKHSCPSPPLYDSNHPSRMFIVYCEAPVTGGMAVNLTFLVSARVHSSASAFLF